MEEPTARVEVGPNGELLLIDPIGCAVFGAVSKHNCKFTFEANSDRIAYFQDRAKTLKSESPVTCPEMSIVVANVDTPFGKAVADVLMPGFDWQSIRDRNEVPFARGLVQRIGMQMFLHSVDEQASEKLQQFKSDLPPVIIIDHGTCEVF